MKIYWIEAANWAAHVLNRNPTLVLKEITQEEVWSDENSYAKYFRVFWCLPHLHVPDQLRYISPKRISKVQF